MEGEIRSLRAELERAQSSHLKPPSLSAAASTADTSVGRLSVVESAKAATFTIAQLRRELERCQTDLETDEVLYTEKVDELNEVRSRHECAEEEVERLKGLWEAGQGSEEALCREVERLRERVRELEAGKVGEREREKTKEEEEEEKEGFLERESRENERQGWVEEAESGRAASQQGKRSRESHEAPGEEQQPVVEGKVEEQKGEEFESCLQLLHGKVRTDREEVSWKRDIYSTREERYKFKFLLCAS